MSYHAPNCLTETDLDELEDGGRAEAVEAVAAEAEKAVKAVGHAAAVPVVEEKECQTVWVVYDYDYQTGRYVRPRMALASEAEARGCRREYGWGCIGWMCGSHGGAWEKAGKPVVEVD
jgi:hypothetical protein